MDELAVNCPGKVIVSLAFVIDDEALETRELVL